MKFFSWILSLVFTANQVTVTPAITPPSPTPNPVVSQQMSGLNTPEQNILPNSRYSADCDTELNSAIVIKPTGFRSLQLGTFFCPQTMNLPQDAVPTLPPYEITPSPTSSVNEPSPTISPTPTGIIPPSPTPTDTSPGIKCTFTIGYWKNHPEDWPVTSISIGGNVYLKNDAINQIFNQPSKGEVWYILAKQLLGAKLNMANGNNPGYIDTIIAQADQWLVDNPLNGYVSDAERREGITFAEILTTYNEGYYGPAHCG